MRSAVSLCPLRPRAANGSGRRAAPFIPTCFASAWRATSDTEIRRRLASRSTAVASSSGRLIVVRFITPS